uniref:Major capsid protein L1 n=1 Tax=Human papillomavirus 66 TaxID=37119 RepID=A9XCV2_HPV66|nr:putative major capsid protein L1 [human papillomavirus 66]
MMLHMMYIYRELHLHYGLYIFLNVGAVNVFPIFLQMAMWRPSDNKVYLPPTPVSKVVATDTYVKRTSIFYHAGSSRLLAVGHPYYSVSKSGTKTNIPKVSAYQYRVFRVRLPDPNKFGLPDPSFYNPDQERLVWACVGLEVGRGQPLGAGLSGHPLFNRLDDTEVSNLASNNVAEDNRDNISVDCKQTQLCIVGCAPALGEHWTKGAVCKSTPVNTGDCPPLALVNTPIEDGDMVDTGFGAMDFKQLQESKAEVPLDIVQSTCKYPDYLKMSADAYGDSMWFYLRREQLFARHYFNRAGNVGEAIPTDLYWKGGNGRDPPPSSVYVATPSGSMITSEAQLFNKPYWLQRAQGHNNGICWGNQVFVTVVDTTRSTNMTINAAKSTLTKYDAREINQYLRHVEEYELQFVFQLCKITLTAEVMAYLHNMNNTLLDDWNIGLSPPVATSLEDKYRYIKSTAITCQREQPPAEKQDPLAKYKFWEVNLQDSFSADLDQFPLGRKFLMQLGPRPKASVSASTKRAAPTSSSSLPAKRKKR